MIKVLNRLIPISQLCYVHSATGIVRPVTSSTSNVVAIFSKSAEITVRKFSRRLISAFNCPKYLCLVFFLCVSGCYNNNHDWLEKQICVWLVGNLVSNSRKQTPVEKKKKSPSTSLQVDKDIHQYGTVLSMCLQQANVESTSSLLKLSVNNDISFSFCLDETIV